MRIDTKTRRACKASARSNVKRHYVIFVLMCLFAAFIGSEFVLSDNFISARSDVMDNVIHDYEDRIIQTEERAASLTGASIFGDKIEELTEGIKLEDEKADEIFSRSAGTINHVINAFTSGTVLDTITSVVLNIVGSPSVADIVMIGVSTAVAIWFWMFIQVVYTSVMRRIILEARLYKKVPLNRFMYFIRTKSWLNVAVTLVIYSVFSYLSLITVIGYPVVFYGLSMVPFITAENPRIRPFEAIKLSWRMTSGNKWNMFVNSLTLFGWDVLGVLTGGMTNIFYTNPYKLALYGEMYARLRSSAIENSVKGCEAFNDRYLFEKCDLNRLKGAYPEAVNVLKTPEYELENLKGAKKFFAEHFGVVLWNTEDEMKYEENQASRQRIKFMRDEMEGLNYPSRLSPLPDTRKESRLSSMHYMRHYSVLSLVTMFFIYSGFGWVWEVVYYYMLQGHYINRGVLHGPWLPIYGAGGLAILIFLFPLRKNIGVHFFATMALCGTLEYVTSVVLEYAFGAEWWNYDGFFLNINGRICLEGLLVFGLAGIAFIYFLSPMLDDVIRKIKPSVLMPVAILLVTLFVFDFIYSNMHPNMGDGITDGFAGHEQVIGAPAAEETV